MTKEEKGVLLESLKEKFGSNPYFYILDAGGMTVDEINKFRRLCFTKGMEYKVLKNSLVKKALESLEADFTPLNDKALKGFSGILFSPESGSAPAKLIKEFRKKGGSEKLTLKGASIDSSFFFGEESLEELTKIRSKEDIIAELIGLLKSPATNLVSAMQGPSQKLVSSLQSGGNNVTGLLKAIVDKKEQEG